MRTTIKTFCENLLNKNFVIDRELWLYLVEVKTSNGWLGDHNYILSDHYANNRRGIALKLMVSNITWHSMQSQMCNNTDKTVLNKEKSNKKNVILLTECEL
jgi:hypothetical protein